LALFTTQEKLKHSSKKPKAERFWMQSGLFVPSKRCKFYASGKTSYSVLILAPFRGNGAK
jgi:hypothetical protein